MVNLFDIIPGSFFNPLGSASNNRIHADCLQIIYQEYDREITYRLSRNRIRDAIALYLFENEIDYTDKEIKDSKNYNDVAGTIIRKLCSKDIAWLEEDDDDATYEKQIIMTEQGIMLAEFLQTLKKPEKEEFSSYIFNISNTLKMKEQWKKDPYVLALKTVYKNAKALSKSLKKLATFIRKIIEKMIQEETLESLTENLMEYCEGDFIKEYARLTKQQNIHIYRNQIRKQLDDMKKKQNDYEILVLGCQIEEDITAQEAEEMVLDMFQQTQRFLTDDYDKIIRDIKHKINLYLQVAIGRIKHIRNKEKDVRGSVEQTIKYIIEEMQMLNMKDEMPDEINKLFALERNEFLDLYSLSYPKKRTIIDDEIVNEIVEDSKEEKEKALLELQKAVSNPYSKTKMKKYLEQQMGAKDSICVNQLPMVDKENLLANLASVIHSEDNKFKIEQQDGYYKTNGLKIRNFKITKEKEENNERNME